MEIVLQGLGALRGMPGEKGMAGLARLLAEACANEITDAEADALCEATGATRDGCRGRPLETQFGTLAPRILKLRAGSHFPGSPTGRRGGRVDRAVTCAASETHALGASTRKVGLALERMGAAEADALAHLDFPEAHGSRMRADNVQERRDREIRPAPAWRGASRPRRRWQGSRALCSARPTTTGRAGATSPRPRSPSPGSRRASHPRPRRTRMRPRSGARGKVVRHRRA